MDPEGNLPQAGCDSPDGWSVEWTYDHLAGDEDPARNATLFVQEFFFRYTPPPDYTTAIDASWTYFLRGASGSPSAAVVTCAVPEPTPA